MARFSGLVLLVACALLGSHVSTLLFATPSQGLRSLALQLFLVGSITNLKGI